MTTLLIIGGALLATIIVFTVGCIVGYDIGVKDVSRLYP